MPRRDGKDPVPLKIPACGGGPGFGYPQRRFAFLKLQISNSKYQTNSNDENSKIQIMSH
jgi:hypothetical protein